MKHKELFLLYHIFNSDDDAEAVEDIFAGYDQEFNLILMLKHTDYIEAEYNCSTYAVIRKDEAYKLALRLRVAMTGLPRAIAATVDDYLCIINPTTKQTRSCFSDLLKMVADNGCKLRLHRNFGANDYTCF